MNHSDITRIAKEAGLFVPQAGIPENGALVRFFHAAYAAGVEAEREGCIQTARAAMIEAEWPLTERVMKAIRSRGKL